MLKAVFNKTITDIRLRPRCAIPPSRLIIDSSNACNQASAPVVCMPQHGPVEFATHKGVRLGWAHVTTKIANSPLEIFTHHVTHCSLRQVHSSSQTASRSVQPLLYGSQMLCCTMHCQWGRKPQKLALPLGFRHPAGSVIFVNEN